MSGYRDSDRSSRIAADEFRAKDVYGDIPGASLLNWPLTLAELEPYYNKAEGKMGVTGTHGMPLLDANNNQIVMAAGAKKVGYKEYSTGNMAINFRVRAMASSDDSGRVLFSRYPLQREMVDAEHRNSER